MDLEAGGGVNFSPAIQEPETGTGLGCPSPPAMPWYRAAGFRMGNWRRPTTRSEDCVHVSRSLTSAPMTTAGAAV